MTEASVTACVPLCKGQCSDRGWNSNHTVSNGVAVLEALCLEISKKRLTSCNCKYATYLGNVI